MKLPHKLALLITIVLSSLGLANAGSVYTQIEYPGAFSTEVNGINSRGDMVGTYAFQGQDTHGFLLHGGAFTTVDVPGAVSTAPTGINDADQIVGFYYSTTGAHGFLFDGQTFTTIDFPGGGYTWVSGINNKGQIVGSYEATPIVYRGFIFSHGNFKTLPDPVKPPPRNVGLDSINNLGEMIGGFQRDIHDVPHSFLYRGGVFTMIEIPGESETLAAKVNDYGVMVGTYLNTKGVYGCFTRTKNRFNRIGIPVPKTKNFGTTCSDINNSGQIVGEWTEIVDSDSFGEATYIGHGFLLTPEK